MMHIFGKRGWRVLTKVYLQRGLDTLYVDIANLYLFTICHSLGACGNTIILPSNDSDACSNICWRASCKAA